MFISQAIVSELKIKQDLNVLDEEFKKLETERRRLSVSEMKGSFSALLYELNQKITQAFGAGWTVKEVAREIPNAYRIFGYSGFVYHIRHWPKGYPGDFEAVNMLVDRKENATSDSLGAIVGYCALNTPIAQQHREKVRIQAEEVKRICKTKDSPRVISIACGSARDLEQIQDELNQANAEVVLIDFDKEALREAEKRLSKLSNLETVEINIRHLPKLLKNGDKADIIYAGGVFDYLPTKIIKPILRGAAKAISPGGIIMFTNINVGNFMQPLMQVVANWNLIERSEEEMAELLQILSGKWTLELEPTRLAWIAKAHF
jgi:SAM-dependent methyltransferase